MATFIQGEDCQGCKTEYYRAERQDSEGSILFGCGATDAEAEKLADERLKAREAEIALRPADRLKGILGKSDLSQRDVEIALRLIGRIILR